MSKKNALTKVHFAKYDDGMRYKSIGDIIARLGGSGEVSRELGLPQSTVSTWIKRNRIKLEWWPAVRALAKKKRKRLTNDEMVAAHGLERFE